MFDLRVVPSGGPRTRAVTRLMRGVHRTTAGFTGADVLAALTRTFAWGEPVMPPVVGRTRLTVLVARRAG